VGRLTKRKEVFGNDTLTYDVLSPPAGAGDEWARGLIPGVDTPGYGLSPLRGLGPSRLGPTSRG